MKDRRSATPSWQCAVRKRERMRALYHKRKLDPEWMEARRRSQRERWPARSADPLYRFQRSLNDMARVFVRY